MAKQYQNPSGIADFQTATFSFWFRIPNNSQAVQAAAGAPSPPFIVPSAYWDGIELVTWGDMNASFSGTNGNSYGSIALCSNDTYTSTDYGSTGSVGGRHDWNLRVNLNANAYPGNSNVYVYGVDSYDAGGLALQEYQGPYMYSHAAYLASPFSYDQWHHVFVAIDISTGDTFGSYEPPDGLGNHNPDTGITSLTRGRIIEIYFDKVRISGVYLSSADATNSFHGPGDENYDVPPTSSPRNILINGLQCAIPTFPLNTPDAVNYNPEIKYAEFQAWFGRYIDPAVHMSKFVSSSGKPVDASVPEAAFGKPTLRFRRNGKKKLQFSTNDGTGGAFTKTGSVTDFNPGP